MSSSIYRRGVAPSVYGGAGGHGTRISTSRHLANYGSDPAGGNLFAGNEKMTMQNLNDRLASYLERVRSLEQSNSHLEQQIKHWSETNTPSAGRDHSAYMGQIKELRDQVRQDTSAFFPTVQLYHMSRRAYMLGGPNGHCKAN